MPAASIPLPAKWIDEAIESAVAKACAEFGVTPDDPSVVKIVARLRAQMDQARLVFPCCRDPLTWTTL